MSDIDNANKEGGKYPPFWLANNLLYRAKQGGIGLTNLHLQKLLYFLHGHYIADLGSPLSNENFQPWYYGPVIQSVYHCCKQYAGHNIKGYCEEFDPANKTLSAYIVPKTDTEFKDVFDKVWDYYGGIRDPYDLVNLSHKYGGAWEKARSGNELYISNDEIKKEFRRIKIAS